MKHFNEKAIRYGSVVSIRHEGLFKGRLLSDGFVDNSVYFTQPNRFPNQSAPRGLFLILPSMSNDVKVPLRSSFRPLQPLTAEIEH